MNKWIFRKAVAGLAVSSLLGLSVLQPATAAMIGTDQAIAYEESSGQIGDVRSLLERDDVRVKLVELGVDPVWATERVAALSEDELARIERSLDELPAGGSALAVIGVVFLVLIILEVVGVIDIFKRT